jgi:hypothetical protein
MCRYGEAIDLYREMLANYSDKTEKEEEAALFPYLRLLHARTLALYLNDGEELKKGRHFTAIQKGLLKVCLLSFFIIQI